MKVRGSRIALSFFLALVALAGTLALLEIRSGGPTPVQAQGADGDAIYYVAPDCSGSPTPCYTTVQAAIDAADDADDEIHVAMGTYTGVNSRGGSNQTTYISKSVTLRGGYSPGFTTTNPISYPTTLDAQGAGRVLFVTGTVTVTVENVTLTGGSADKGGGLYANAPAQIHLVNDVIEQNAATTNHRGAGIDTDGASVWLIDSVIQNNGGADDVGALIINGAETYVEGNTVEGNGYNGLYLSGGNTGQVTVIDNRIVDNGDSGLMVGWGTALVSGNVITGNGTSGSASDGGGIRAIQLADGSTFRNNVVAANDAARGSGLYVSVNGEADHPIALHWLHNTVADNTGGSEDIYLTGSYLTALFTNTIISGTNSVGVQEELDDAKDGQVQLAGTLWNTRTTTIAGNQISTTGVDLQDDPAFVAGYRLSASSPAVDAGVDAGQFWTDVDGDPRPAGYGFDIGADERPGTALQMVKTVSDSSLAPGEGLTYTIAITVAGGGGTDLQITDTLPAQQQALAVTSDGGACSLVTGYGGGVTCTPGNVGAGTYIPITLTAQMTTVQPARDELPLLMTNTLTAQANEAAYQVHAHSQFGDCRARVNGVTYDTVQAAIDAAEVGDLVKLAGYCSTLNSHGTEIARIATPLTLRGGYTPGEWSAATPDPNRTILDAQGAGRVLFISNTVAVTVENLTLTGGSADKGGGLYAETPAEIYMVNNVIEGNAATEAYRGAGIDTDGASVWLIDSVIRNNDGADDVGALIMNGAQTYVEGNTVEGNGYNGLYLSGGGTGQVTVIDNRIVGNSDGGLMVGWGTALVSGNIITGNGTSGDADEGGGLRALSCRLTATHNLIMDNAACEGGGIYARNLLTDSRFSNNVIARNAADATFSGGGLYLYDTSGTTQTVHLIHNTIVSNTQGNNGVHVSEGSGSVFTIYFTNTIIAGHPGTGVAASGATVELVGTLWHNNDQNFSGSDVVTATPDLHADPALAADGYHLTGASAALDRIYDIPVADDVDGDPRPIPNDSAADIGADEHAYPVDLGLTKAVAGSGSRQAGEMISYTLTVTGAGPIRPDAVLTDAFTPASAVDGLTATVTAGIGSCQAASAALTCTLTNVPTDTAMVATVWMTTTGTFGGVVTNTASVTPAFTVDPNPANNASGPVTVTVLAPAPDLWVAKQASARYLQSSDTLTYTLQWGNQGGQTASDAVLTDTLPPHVTLQSAEGSPSQSGDTLIWNLGALAPQAAGSYEVVVTADDGLDDGTLLVNEAVIGSASGELTPDDNTDQVTGTVYATGGISLTVSKDAFGIVGDEVELEDEIDYTIVISNSGLVSTSFTLEDEIPEGTEYVNVWSQPLGAAYIESEDKIYWDHTDVLTAGASATVTLRVRVTECGGDECGVIRNVAQVGVPDVSYVWQSPPRELWVKCPDLGVTIQERGTDGFPAYFHYDGLLHGNEYGWLLTYENVDKGDHTSLAANPHITLTLEGNAHFDTATIDPAPVQADDHQIVWHLPQLAPGEAIDDVATEDVPSFDIVLDSYDDDGYALAAEIAPASGQECASQRSNNTDEEEIPAVTMGFEKQALTPRVTWLHANGQPTDVRFSLGYKMLLHYRNSAPWRMAHDLEIDDLWPTGLPLDDWDGHLDSWGEWDLRQENDNAIWSADWALEGAHGWIEAQGTISQTTAPHTQFTNQAWLSFAPEDDESVTYQEEATATVEVPLLQPVILRPQGGLQLCPGDTFQVAGIAQKGATVNVYLNGALQTTVSPDNLGTFSAVLTAVPGGNTVEVSASHGGEETGRSAVTVQAPSNLLWAPYGSSVVGTVTTGPQKGQVLTFDIEDPSDFRIPGVYGFNDMLWNFRTCGCPDPTQTMTVTVSADGGQYTGSDTVPGDGLSFASVFLAHAHDVAVSATCLNGGSDPVTQTTEAEVLIDPDGYVFDIDQGGSYDPALAGTFNPVEPISGVTVTAYVSEPTWGGWIPWPAHVYSQTNPQVTDDSYPDGITTTGYYAFYTPPGHYYLEVEGGTTAEGRPYQRWRSPVIEVVTEPVHVNVPYTPLPEKAGVTVTLTAEGISSPVITIPVGSAVEWTSALSASDTITDLIRWDDNPVLHPRSDLDPLLNPLGFDAGFLEPGASHRRRFTETGTYIYSDAAGHSGAVVVTEWPRIYLPLVLRNTSR